MKKIIYNIIKAAGAALLFFLIALIFSTIYFKQEWEDIKKQEYKERSTLADSLGYTENDIKRCDAGYFSISCHKKNMEIYAILEEYKEQNNKVKNGAIRKDVNPDRWLKAIKVADVLGLDTAHYNEIYDNLPNYKIKVLSAQTWIRSPSAQVPYRYKASLFGYACANALITIIIMLFWNKKSNLFKRIIYLIPFAFISYIITKEYQNWLLNITLINGLFYWFYAILIKPKWERKTTTFVFKWIKYLVVGQYMKNLGVGRICVVLGIILLCIYIYIFANMRSRTQEVAVFFIPFVYFVPFIMYWIGEKVYFWIKDGFAKSKK